MGGSVGPSAEAGGVAAPIPAFVPPGTGRVTEAAMALNKTRFPAGTDPVSAVMAAAARAAQAQRAAFSGHGLTLVWRQDAAGRPVMGWMLMRRPVAANDLAANDAPSEGRTRHAF
ncbi:hypothetical protein [Azospirillum sp. B4]|uniref:hypothetical protein n=1 Tax=Azospirillum sp. B4 TaxID=95605 RepID=UPI0011DD3EC7|nr:hypothetical protein [Azospirillum sp. B4]